jgi:hypothetical protein
VCVWNMKHTAIPDLHYHHMNPLTVLVHTIGGAWQ